MSSATPVYQSLMLEAERRRQQLGVSMERFSEFAGLPDRAYSKMLWVTSKDRKQASWESVQRVVDALFPDGFDIVLKARKGPQLDILSAKFKARFGAAFHDRRVLREHMSEIGKAGGLNSRLGMDPVKKKRLARRAAKRRWNKPKIEEITPKNPDAKRAVHDA